MIKIKWNSSFILSRCWKVLLVLVFLRPFLSEYTYLRAGVWYVTILILFSAIYLTFSHRPILPPTPFNFPVFLFIIALLLSTAFSISRRWSSFELFCFFPNILIFYVVSKTDRKQRRQIIVTLIAAASIISIYAIYQYFFIFKYALEHLVQPGSDPHVEEILGSNRMIGTFISPNILASYQIMILFFGLGLLVSSLQIRRLPLWLGVSIFSMTIALLSTKSLGGILAFIVSLLLFIFLPLYYLPGKMQDKRAILRVNLTISIGLIILIFVSVFFLRGRLLQLLQMSNVQNSLVQRLYYWKASLKVIKDFPLTGTGWRSFGLLYKYYKLPEANISNFSHNCFLQIMAETGPLGLVSFSWIVFIFLREGLKNLKNGNHQQYGLKIGIFCAGCAFLLHNLIDLSFYFNQVCFHWWIILGLLKGSNSLNKSHL